MAATATLDDNGSELARQSLDQPSHFIRALTDLAEQREVVATKDIYAKSGIKLVSRGARLSGRFYDRLIAHKLLKPIEESIAVARMPDSSHLVAQALAEIARLPALDKALGDAFPRFLEGVLSALVIPGPLTTKLAVIEHERPRLFRHSLLAMIVALALGMRGRLARGELAALAVAALFHDVGELYIDPEILCDGRHLTTDERRYIYAHPITGFLVLRAFPGLPAGTAQAVLQHHERLDSAGYPHRLPAGKITRIARYLAVAEVAASLVENYGADRRIGMKFRMNIKKYDAHVVTLVCRLFTALPANGAQAYDEQRLLTRLGQLGQLFEGWSALVASCPTADIASIAPIVDRVDGLRMMALEPGYDQYRLEDLIDESGDADAEICSELSALLDELTWHFGALCRGVEREQRVWGLRIPATIAGELDAWLDDVRRFLGSKGAAAPH